MKTTSRKRLLVSSVAMLLVAILALGTATFAWFTTSTTATTKNLSVRTSKASTLEISKDTGAWGTTVDYNFVNKLLMPVSTSNGTAWFSATATSQAESAYATGTVGSVETDATTGHNDSYFFKSQLNVRNAGDAAVNNVKIKFSIPTGTAAYDYLRVAIVETDAQGVNRAAKTGAVFNIFDNGSNNSSTTTVNGEETTTTYSKAYKAITGVSGTGETQSVTLSDSITPTASTSSGSIEFKVADSLAAKNGETYAQKFYNIYVWFEGQDIHCYSNNAVEIPEITFTVEGTTADQT